MEHISTVNIGMGPSGLSATARLKARSIFPFIAGWRRECWQHMPLRIFLKFSENSISISDHAHIYTLDHFGTPRQLHKRGPVPLQSLLDYAQWFQQELVAEIEQMDVMLLAQDGKAFHLALADGRSLKANGMGAPGIAPFAQIPAFTAHLPAGFFSHTQQYIDPCALKGKRAVVVGSGHSPFEAAWQSEEVCLQLSDGTTGQVDRVVPGTDYRPAGQKLTSIAPSLRQRVAQQHGRPLLTPWFEPSVPRLSFASSLAGYIFGPLCRFVAGAGVAARQITRHTVLSR